MISVRLAYHPQGGKSLISKTDEVTVRLAHRPGAQGDNVLMGHRGIERLANESAPALLVSYVYLEPFLKHKHLYNYRDWVLDSGAFSAHNSGTEIRLDDYIRTSKTLLETDSTLSEVFALDVIGDWKASAENCRKMWNAGVPAIPCFHPGEPEAELVAIARDYPKIALGGCVGFRDKQKFAQQCFSRIWPKKVHGFGFGAEKDIMALPWHSVDATNWELGPCKFGQWNSFGKMSVRGSKQNLRAEVEYYLRLEKKARLKWSGAMKQLNEDGMSVRLAMANTSERAYAVDKYPNAIGNKITAESMSIRLAVASNRAEETFKAK